MQIKVRKKESIFTGVLSNSKTLRKSLPVLFLGFIVLISFSGGYSLKRSGFPATDLIAKIISPIKHLRQPGKYIIPNFTANPRHIYLNIKYEDFQRLAYQREQAINKGILITSDDAYVSAGINYNGKTVKVKLRLKGDWTDHLQFIDKWSFRIKVCGDETLLGMKRFSIQHTFTRNYLYEWVYHQLLKKEDILSLRYDFINVTLNGKDLGIYALEEHFDERLLENHQRREGPIIKFSEDVLWQDRLETNSIDSSRYFDSEYSQSYYSSEIDLFQSKKSLSDPTLKNQFEHARTLLELFRLGNYRATRFLPLIN